MDVKISPVMSKASKTMANDNQIGKAETFVEEYLPINKIFNFDDNFSANDEVLKSSFI